MDDVVPTQLYQHYLKSFIIVDINEARLTLVVSKKI